MRDSGTLEQQLEAMLTVALEPITAAELADVLGVETDTVTATLRGLQSEYVEEKRGFVFVELASGWTMQSSPDVADAVTRFANRDVSHRLSAAALETLAIIAYRQPISRVQISALRGVNVDGVSRLLEQRGYIEVVGKAEGPGQPVLYGTTEIFLDRMGLASLDMLPPIENFLPPVSLAHELADEMVPSVPEDLDAPLEASEAEPSDA
jgi:segregation and condensation protein B